MASFFESKTAESSVIITFALFGCGAPSVEDLKNDVSLLKNTVNKCEKMSRSDIEKNEACRNAIQAQQELAMGTFGDVMKGIFGSQ